MMVPRVATKLIHYLKVFHYERGKLPVASRAIEDRLSASLESRDCEKIEANVRK